MAIAYESKRVDQVPAKILVVDDDPDLAGLLKELLTSQGHEVTTAATGREALSKAETNPDLVLLDLMLPDLNGYEVCRALKQNPKTSHIPVVMLTARADTRDKVGGLKAGADDYITKPFDIEELLARVEAMLRLKRGEDALRERNRELAMLLETNRTLSASLDLRQVVAQVLHLAQMAAPEAVAGAVLLYSEDRKTLKVEAAWGRQEVPCLRSEIPADEGWLARALASGDIVPLELPKAERQGQQGDRTPEVEAPALHVWCAPISHQDEPVGVIAFFGQPGSLPQGLQKTLIEAIASQAGLAMENAKLFQHISGMFESSVHLLAAAIDARDPSTHSHSKDVARYARAIAEAMGLPPAEVDTIERAALLHDIGKIGIVDSILGKPGPLTPGEQAAMMAHPRIGAAILEEMPDLADLVPIVRHHHERWDGKGYPDGLAGERIPLGARILAVADAFEAMTSNRPYRHRQSQQSALETLLAGRGTQFDPQVVDAFIRSMETRLRGALPHPEAVSFPRTDDAGQSPMWHLYAREVALIYELFRDTGAVLNLPALLERIQNVLGQQMPDCHFTIEILPASVHMGPRAVELADAEKEAGREQQESAEERLYPLSLDGQVLAVLHVTTTRPGGLSEEDSTLLRQIAPQLALLIDVGIAHNPTPSDARDPQTGLYTPRYLRQRLEEETARARRLDSQLSVCLISVNGAAQTRSQASRQRAADLSATVAQVLRTTVRASDLAAHYRRDEYALVAIQADTEGIGRLIGRFESRLSELLQHQFGQPNESVDVSIKYGIAGYPYDSAEPSRLLELAELRLARAKRQKVRLSRR